MRLVFVEGCHQTDSNPLQGLVLNINAKNARQYLGSNGEIAYMVFGGGQGGD